MLSNEEKQILDAAKSQGKTYEQALADLSYFKHSQGTTSYKDERPISMKITDALGLGGAVDVFGSHLARMGVGEQTAEQGKQFIEKPTGKQTAGALMQTGAIPLGAVLTGGSSLVGQMAVGAGIGYLYDVGSDLAEGNENPFQVGAGTIAGAAVPPVLRGAGMALKGATGLAVGASKGIANTVSGAVPQGVRQVAGEFAERLPRAVGKGQDILENAAVRSERIRTSSPEVQVAIKSGLDDVVIDAVSQADDATKKAYAEMVKIAEAPRTGLRPATRPESVAGNAIADQYTILDKQRNAVGQQIGDAVDQLSTKGAVDVLPAQRTMRDILRQNGIMPDASGVLKFGGSSLTPKQQALVQQLYELATPAEALTPRQVYNMDKLFSQLQREARFDNLDTIYLSTPDGQVNIFRAFRNIYSNQLDQIAPEIAPLNKQYAQLRNLQDDIEASIVKRGSFESTRDVDPAEFAQTNLRRIFSDAQSAADYRALADKLDAYARSNGYSGANPQDLAGFAQRLRTIYPETTPETSFQGGITGGIKNVIGKVLDLGKPDVTDQQKALKQLLNITDDQAKEAFGAIAGFEVDENGEVSFNPYAGIAGVSALSLSSASRSVLIQTQRELIKRRDNLLKLGFKTTSAEVKAVDKAHAAVSKRLGDNK